MSKLLREPEQFTQISNKGRYQALGLTENPFPSEPYVNEASTDKRMNGGIYETEVHKQEYQQIIKTFISQSQADPNHLRLGYIIDTSYIGRGNGKSAFLINLKHFIDHDYCDEVSGGNNKCFAIYVSPEPGGRTKTFPSFVDLLFQSIIKSEVIQSTLATLRLQALKKMSPKAYQALSGMDDNTIIQILNSEEWFQENNIDLVTLSEEIFSNEYLQKLPPDFPLFKGRGAWLPTFVSIDDFIDYYRLSLKRSSEKIYFVFSHLVDLFIAAKFNGAYVLVDDYERIPDFQSERQKRDFALELRSCLFDGLYTNATVGFFNFLLVFHAGVPRLIGDAWALSGMEHRAPILPKVTAKHIIRFEKLNKKHASLLLKKYLSEYRISDFHGDSLSPFTEDAAQRIGEMSEYNAARMLGMANQLLEKAADTSEEILINSGFIDKNLDVFEDEASDKVSTIRKKSSIDLQKKAKGK